MSARTYVRIDVVVEGEWRIGTWRDSDEEEDRSLLSFASSLGEPYLPGSSVRGSLRDHLVRTVSAAAAERAFGPLAESADLVAGPWWVLAAPMEPGSWSSSERAQTAMNRRRRAPANTSLRRGETVSPVGPGPHVRVYLRCDATAATTTATDLLTALDTWAPRLGGGRSTGLGHASVAAVRYRQLHLDQADDLTALLTAGNSPNGIDRLIDDARGQQLTVTPQEAPLLLGCDFVVPDGWAAPEDPAQPSQVWTHGSTWKGLIRSRVEFIGRSLGASVCGDRPDPTPHEDDTSADVGDAVGSGKSSPEPPCGSCDVCGAFGSPSSAGTLEFMTTPVRWSPPSDGGARRRVRHRNALDRFTGGGRDKLLFKQGSEHGVTLRLEIRALPPRADGPVLTPWVIRAVAHAVRDMADGLVGLGRATSTGLGSLRADTLTVGPLWQPEAEGVHIDGVIDLADLDRLPVEVTS